MSGGAARIAVVVAAFLCSVIVHPALSRGTLVEHSVVSVGVEVPYQVSGQGDPVILLHDGYGTAGYWTNRIPHLTDNFQVIDIGSVVGEPATSHERTFARSVTAVDVIAVMDDLGLARADLVGWGDGAMLSLELAIHHQARVNRIVLFGPIFGQFACFGPTAEHLRLEAAFALQATAKFRENAAAAETWDQGIAGRGASRQPAANFTADQLAAITTPILMLDGEPGGRVPAGYMKQVAQLIPGPKLMIRPCTSQWAYQAQPEQLTSIVITFLTS